MCSAKGTYPLGSDGLGDKVVLVHGSDPLAYGGAGLGDLGDGQWREVFVVYVRLDLGNHLIWNMVLLGEGGVEHVRRGG